MCVRMPHLYFTKASCGAASYLAAKRGEIIFDTYNIVDLAKHRLTRSGEEYHKINPKGNVPTIVLDDGEVINENVGCLYWLGKNGKNEMLGKSATDEYATVNLLGFLASEVHANFHRLFNPKLKEEEKQACWDILMQKFEYLSSNYLKSGKQSFLIGDSFTVADSYFYIMLRWPSFVGIDISSLKVISEYKNRIGNLSFIKEAHAEMEQLEIEQKQGASNR